MTGFKNSGPWLGTSTTAPAGTLLAHQLSKVALVLFGSLSAAKAAADQLLGAASKGDIVLFAGVGVLSAVVAGVMAAFQFDTRASALAQLAAEADSAWRRADSLLAQGSSPTDVLAQQNASLDEIKGRAAKLGINTVLNLHEKRRSKL